jgi:hypothetical protein
MGSAGAALDAESRPGYSPQGASSHSRSVM